MEPPVEDYAAFYALTYDASVSDWPGEIDFYRQYAAKAGSRGLPVLELACGTGRVALEVAQLGCEVVGLDHSLAMSRSTRPRPP